MKWRLKRPIGTVEGYESELLNENGARIATVYCGFDPFPPHASWIQDAPEAVEAVKLFATIFSDVGMEPRNFARHKDAGRFFALVNMVCNSQRNALDSTTRMETDK